MYRASQTLSSLFVMTAMLSGMIGCEPPEIEPEPQDEPPVAIEHGEWTLDLYDAQVSEGCREFGFRPEDLNGEQLYAYIGSPEKGEIIVDLEGLVMEGPRAQRSFEVEGFLSMMSSGEEPGHPEEEEVVVISDDDGGEEPPPCEEIPEEREEDKEEHPNGGPGVFASIDAQIHSAEFIEGSLFIDYLDMGTDCMVDIGFDATFDSHTDDDVSVDPSQGDTGGSMGQEGQE